jgi:hypothetical protein
MTLKPMITNRKFGCALEVGDVIAVAMINSTGEVEAYLETVLEVLVNDVDAPLVELKTAYQFGDNPANSNLDGYRTLRRYEMVPFITSLAS